MRIGSAALVAVAALSCGSRPAAAPEGMLTRYRLDRPPASRVTLPAELHEVSGLAVTADGRLFAHGDERGVVFQVDPGTGEVVKQFSLRPGDRPVDLGKKASDGQLTGDFEDIAIVGERFFLVTSNGVLVEFREGRDGEAVPFTAYPTPLDGICEVEGLAFDRASDALLLLCKQTKDKAARHRVEIYSWSLRDRRLDAEPRLTIPFDALAPLTGAKAFNGSALVFLPGGKSLALVAGPQHVYAEIGLDGKPITGGALDRAAQPQPEGMAFLPDGTLLVSSEGGKGDASINAYQPSSAR
jgi:uncharacterized protein YjiK